MKTKQKLKEFFSLDYRSLALMRFAVGLVLILDLITRAVSLVAHYSDNGVLPRADALTLSGNQFFVSIHMLSGLWQVQALFFLIAGIFAFMLMIGYRTRLAVIVSWFLLISLHARNPMILQGGDVVLRTILFWMMFLPLGQCWSIDKLTNRTHKAPTKTYLSVSTIAYVTQIFLIYFMTGILKSGEAWQNGTAVYYALSIDQLARPFGVWLLNYPFLGHFLTKYTLVLEVFGPFLLFSPIATGLIRTYAIVLFALLQIGFNLSLSVGLFGAIMIAITLGLLPAYFWDRIIKPIRTALEKRASEGLTIYYDADCSFCYKMTHVLKRFLLLSPSTRILPADSSPAIAHIMQERNSWVVTDKHGTSFLGFRGVAAVFGYSPVFAWVRYICLLPGVRTVGQYAYEQIAAKRLYVCLPEKVRHPHRHAKTIRYATNTLVGFLLVYTVAWNINTTGVKALPVDMQWIGFTTRLDQQFNMFAPKPLIEDGWYIIPGNLKNGTTIDLFRTGPQLNHDVRVPVSRTKPTHIAALYESQRWQKYLMNIAEAKNSKFRLDYGRYICRTWNAQHTGDDTLMDFRIIYMIETTPPEGEQAQPPREAALWTHRCFETTTLPPPPPENEQKTPIFREPS